MFVTVTRAILITAAVSSFGLAAAADPVKGNFTVQGKTAEGSDYTGTATITREGDGCKISWKTPDVSEGPCFEYQKAFVAYYTAQPSKASGFVIYAVMDNGQLNGFWNVDGKAGTGSETLTPVR